MNCMDAAPGTDFVTAGFGLAVLVTIYWIRKRWAAREAAGFVKVAYWWEAIVHALAVSVVIVVGVAFVLGFLFRNGA